MKPCLFNYFRSCQYGFWTRSANRARRLHNATTARAQLRYFLAGLAILLVASVCDAQTRQELATLKGHDDVVYSVAFSALAKAAPRSDVVEWASVPRSMRETHSPTCTEPSAPN